MYIQGSKVLDASYINSLADTVQTWQRWFWYMLIILFGADKTYKLIRGTSMLNSGNYQGGNNK